MGERDEDDESVERQVRAFLQNSQLERNAAYAGRGRAYRNLSDGELRVKWAAAYTAYAEVPSDQERRRLQSDLGSEIDLRGLELPLSMVPEAWAQIKARVSSAIHDPGKRAEIDEELVEDLAKFKRASERKN